MNEAPSTGQLAAAAGISKSYASEIVNGIRRPARALAIHIFRRTGWKHDSIGDLTDDQIETLETIEPWSPRPAPAPSVAPLEKAA